MSEKLAIDGGTPVRVAPWPSWPMWDEREEKALLEVLHSGVWNDRGNGKIAEFEKKFSAYQHAAYGMCVPSGTSSLELSLLALGVGPGDEVITSSYTFTASAAAIFQVGALPVLADVEPGTLNLDPADVERRITPRTKALMPVHIGGQPADMDGILAVAKRHGLPVVEDACQAWGAAWTGKRVGALGQLGGFSFQASKNINAGEGGFIVTNDADLYERVWALHNAGRSPTRSRHEPPFTGYNYRMTEFQAAILLAQLERLPEHLALREANAACLDEMLDEIPGITPRQRPPQVTSSALHLYMFNYQAASFGGLPRADLIKTLQAEGIPCSPGYQPLYRAVGYRRLLAERNGLLQPWEEPQGDLPTQEPCPACEKACEETVWLNQWQLLADRQAMEDIATAIRKIQAAKA